MKLYFFYLLALNCLISTSQTNFLDFDHYKVQLTIEDRIVKVTTLFYLEDIEESKTKNVFELNQGYTNINVSEQFTLINKDDKNIITITPNPKSFPITFSYTANLDSLGIKNPNTSSYTFLDTDIIPLVHSKEVYSPFTYEVICNNQNTIHKELFSNACKKENHNLISDDPTDRLIIHISKNKVKQYCFDDFTIYSDEEVVSDRLDFIETKVKEIVSFYNTFFIESEKQMKELIIFLNSSFSNSFFSRKNFICLNSSGSERRIQYFLAHELGHYWCSTAQVYNYMPDAFLNESLTEYLAYMWYRHRFGKEKFDNLIKRKQQILKGQTLSILDISHDTMKSGTLQRDVLYTKGSLICYQLERHLGNEKFKTLLSTIVSQNITTLLGLKQLLHNNYGKETATFFNELLMSRSSF